MVTESVKSKSKLIKNLLTPAEKGIKLTQMLLRQRWPESAVKVTTGQIG